MAENESSARFPVDPEATEEVATERLLERTGSFSEMCVCDVVSCEVVLPETYGRLSLRERDGAGRVLTIPVSLEQASQLSVAIRELATPRPLSHATFVEILSAYGIMFELVSITGMTRGNYLAEITSTGPDGTRKHFPARPSDAVLLALRSPIRPPIMVSEALF